MTEVKEVKEPTFTVMAESENHNKPLLLFSLTFARLIDDIVYPYEEKKPFFIDGVPLTQNKIKRLNIIREHDKFRQNVRDLHWKINRNDNSKILVDQYDTRLLAVIREGGDDVTSQVIKAYSHEIKPSIKDYIPKREELIKAALTVLIESIKILSK